MLAVLGEIFSPPETLAIVLQLSHSAQTRLEHDAKPGEINSKILTIFQ